MPRLLPAFFTLAIACLQGVNVVALWADDPPVSFNRDVRPVLSDICFQCHGPDAQKREADLRLDNQEGLLGGDDPIIVPGNLEASRLYQRIVSANADEVM